MNMPDQLLPRWDEEAPAPVPVEYARALIDGIGGINQAMRVLKMSGPTCERLTERWRSGQNAMPWATAEHLRKLITRPPTSL